MCLDEHRSISHDHICIIDLEVQGIYRAPARHPAIKTTTDETTRVAYALEALRDGRLADLQVVCEDERAIGCSSRLLEARWSWFAERSQQARPTEIHISESYPVVQAFLEYVYTLDLVTPLQLRVPVLTGLLMFAKQYEVDHLRKLCVHALHGRLDDATALGIYEIATLCEERGLQVRALKMVLVSPPFALPFLPGSFCLLPPAHADLRRTGNPKPRRQVIHPPPSAVRGDRLRRTNRTDDGPAGERGRFGADDTAAGVCCAGVPGGVGGGGREAGGVCWTGIRWAGGSVGGYGRFASGAEDVGVDAAECVHVAKKTEDVDPPDSSPDSTDRSFASHRRCCLTK